MESLGGARWKKGLASRKRLLGGPNRPRDNPEGPEFGTGGPITTNNYAASPYSRWAFLVVSLPLDSWGSMTRTFTLFVLN